MATRTKKNALDWALAPRPGSKGHFTLESAYDLFIGGKWVKPRSGKHFGHPHLRHRLTPYRTAHEANP